MNSIKLENANCLDCIKKLPDNSVDLIFADPPYNLSSQVYIKENGKPDLKKAKDFMDKWSGLDGEFLEEFYKECLRVLKYGGHCLLFGIDRQLFMFEYYANLSGFTQKQSLYWYFISNFPKASDLSKMIDKNAGAEREVVGDKVSPDGKKAIDRLPKYKSKEEWNYGTYQNDTDKTTKITAPTTHLAKKYEGIKYSVAPLKQTNETIMVFQKPYKTGSCLHDVLAMENGDDTLTCGGVDIDGNRCGVNGGTKKATQPKQESKTAYGNGINGNCGVESLNNGRFPAQTYIDSGASEIIDLQSGVLKSGGSAEIGRAHV
jgi:site-specific DNA-methyltransferase (adenine-specific)